MSNIKTNKKIILITLGILLILSLLVGVSYAYYMVTHSQTNSNIVKSTCISLSLTNEQNDISLDKQYPISDEDGASLTPYSFTITNTCRNAISYNLNLEMLEGTTLDSKYVKTMLNTRGAVNLATLDTTDTSINTSSEARTLTTGVLSSEESINYEFRMWMDGSTEADTNSMNKEFLAKIVVTGVPTKVYNFDYTGTEQVFTVPQTGKYKIETWGAQGGSDTYWGGQGGVGGYSKGYINLARGEEIYINIGGNGQYGGYNGGNELNDKRDASGGGATHISKTSGLLSSLVEQISKILIVSGGGGGAERQLGGSGGGYIGNTGKKLVDGYNYFSTGGTQNRGGTGIQSDSNLAIYDVNGKFGQGGMGNSDTDSGPDGGGGFFGGGAATWAGGAGGGSGYIGNPLLTNKVMYCYNCEESSEESTKTISTTCSEETPTENCAKKGNGYARITYIG